MHTQSLKKDIMHTDFKSKVSIALQLSMDTGLEAQRKIHDESRRCNARSEFFCAVHDERNITQRAAVCMLYNLM